MSDSENNMASPVVGNLIKKFLQDLEALPLGHRTEVLKVVVNETRAVAQSHIREAAMLVEKTEKEVQEFDEVFHGIVFNMPKDEG